MNKVITISREFGSGGRELGMKLAARLGIPCYDKELISMAAEESELAEEAFLHYDERLPVEEERGRFYTPFSIAYEVPMSDQIFVAQSRVMKRLAEEGSCVIVGRCADMVLEDSINLFIYAKMKYRMKRMNSLGTGVDPEKMESRIRDVDRKRKDYYQYYTGNEWGKAQNYHLCLESGLTGVDGCLDTVLAYINAAQNRTPGV